MFKITIPFNSKRTPRELLTEALDQLPLVHCPDHPRERLEIDRETTLKNLMQTPRLILHSEHEHCGVCPFVTRDRSAFDKWRHERMASELKRTGWLFGIEYCAALPYVPRSEPDFAALPNDAPRPTTRQEESIDPDLAPELQLSVWVAGKGVASCAFGRASGIAGSDALPVTESSVTLRKLQREWEEETADDALVAAYKVCPDIAACPGCRLARCGVPPVLQSASFENFIIDPLAIAAHLAKCREYAANPRGFLLMLGSVGNGKTHLAVAIARARLPDRDILFLSHDNFLIRCRARYDLGPSSGSQLSDEDEQPPDVLTEAREARLLIFDDLGRRHEGRDEEALLFSLFNHRYEHRLPTIIMANLKRDGFEQLVGTALFDRMRGACFSLLDFNFPSRRPARNEDYLSQ